MTDAERMLWSILRNRQLDGFKFRRQATIDPFVVDFLCVEAALAVELDGGQHDEDRDRRRTVYLEARGLHILRFWNHDVVENIEGVADAIRSARDCQDFRVWPGIMGNKESHYVTTQRTCHTE
jgi:very-short-patch-repair endonuclease